MTAANPLKNWTNGDVFYGGDMNALVLNSNMRFASATERSSIMAGDLAPRNGLVSYLADVKAATRYNGTTWAPLPPTLMFSYTTNTTSALPSGTVTPLTFQVTLLKSSVNYGNWFTPASGQFNPQLPGYYEFAGGASVDAGAGGAYGGGSRSVGVRFNGVLQPQSACAEIPPGTNVISTMTMRPYVQYMNGTSDYVQLALLASAGASINVTNAGISSAYFSGKYLGA
jgi:hypothetical protein